MPRDGKPISDWTNANTAFLNVIQEIRRIVDQNGDFGKPEQDTVSAAVPVRAMTAERRYRVQREFDEIDRSDFREASFRAIKDYFRNAVQELNSVEGLRGRFTDLGENSFGCVVVNRGLGRGTAHVTVYCGRGRHFFSDIYFSFSENVPENTANGGFQIESDEYDLFLRPMMGLTGNGGRRTPEAAAASFWTEFLQKAGVSHA